MPGIVGIISPKPPEECERLVNSMLATMRHERFYAAGVHVASEMGIYAGWTAHAGSFAAGQVFFNERKDVALLLSGECFADPSIRTPPVNNERPIGGAKGDWLVHHYEENAEQFFQNLNGLFSGLLIDKRLRKVFLFNDRYGVERIYWHENGDGIFFASEAKALLRVLPELRAFDQEGVAQFLTFGCTLGERTLFRGVHLLPGASLWCFEGGKCRKQKYFSKEIWESQPILSAESFDAKFQDTFKRILPCYFEAESKIGISLTAGLDSRMIMALLPNVSENPVCYTFSGQKQETLDARLAARVAKTCGLEHQILRIGVDFLSEFDSHADRTVCITDGSLGILGAHEIYLNKQARSLAPVRLTGVFGGEILRGVSQFKSRHLSRQLLNPDLAQSLSCAEQEPKRNGQHPVTFAAFREIPEKRFGVPAASRSQVTFRTPYLDNELVALAYQMPEKLRISTVSGSDIIKRNALPLSAIPTDMGQIAEAHSIAAPFKKFFSKVAFKLDYLHSEGLPSWMSGFDPVLARLNSRLGVAGLHKFLDYRQWFKRELADYASGVLKKRQVRQNPFWNSDFVENLAREHARGRRNYMAEIDAVLTLEAVERLLFHDLSYKQNDRPLHFHGAVLTPVRNKTNTSPAKTE